MPPEVLQCNPNLCDFRFEAIEKSIDKIADMNSSGQEQIQTIARAVDKIQVTYEQMATTLERLEQRAEEPKQIIVQAPAETNESKMWKLFEKVMLALIAIAGYAAGANLNP